MTSLDEAIVLEPGSHICIVPAERRVRPDLYLPFVDPDEMTSEIISKILLLARDRLITDRTILEQIARRRP